MYFTPFNAQLHNLPLVIMKYLVTEKFEGGKGEI